MSGCSDVRALVLADTHVGPDLDRVPRAVWDAARGADVILHAGDVTGPELLAELARHAPTHAVLGNNDRGLDLPDRLELALGGVAVAMVHDSGPTKGRPGRMARWFPEAEVVVYGHSHQPDDTPGVDGQLLFNPGSCTQRRRAPHRTYGWLELDQGRLIRHELVDLPS